MLLGAEALPKIFPMLMTAAGTITPARVLMLGAGVAGLQAIATARRLGAVVSAYDVRSAVKEQIESLGAKFVVLDIETSASEGQGGYAKAMDEEFYRRQRAAAHGGDPRAGRGDHHGGGSRQESSDSGDRGDGERDGARAR